MTSEEFYAIHDDPDKGIGEKLNAWIEWCKEFDEREADRKADAEANKEYEL